MSRCTSEVIVCGVVGEFTDKTLRLYFETLFSFPERSQREKSVVVDLRKILFGRRVILIPSLCDTTQFASSK